MPTEPLTNDELFTQEGVFMGEGFDLEIFRTRTRLYFKPFRDSIGFTVADATALRDYLNRVVP